MTMPAAAPLSQPTLIAQRSAISLSPQALNERTTLLSQNGHGWMPADMTMTLAASQHSDNELLAIADGIKSSVAQTWNGFSETFDDTVLHRQPTKALTLARFIHASLGPLPVREDDLGVIQANLQKAGFGAGLSVNGVWGPDWNAAYNQWSSDLTARQLAGARPGSVTATHAAHGILSAIMPTHVVSGIVGFAKSLPGDIRDFAADTVGYAGDVAGHLADAGEALVHGDAAGTAKAVGGLALEAALGGAGYAFRGPRTDTGAAFGKTVENLGDQTPQSAQQYRDEHGAGRLLQNVGLVLALFPVVGEASMAARVARAELERGVTLEAAQRGPGVIAKSILGGRSAAQITADEAADTLTRRGLFQNVPLLRQISPQVGRLADADGWYYRKRTLLARPYKYPAVRIAGREFQNANLYGGALNLAAGAENALGAGNPMSRSIAGEDLGDTVDRHLRRIDGTLFAHHFSIGLNDLALVMHGPLGGADAPSARVGNHVQELVDGMSNASGRIGVHGAFEMATGKSLDELRKTFGSDEHLDRFVAAKTADLAAAHYVHRTLNQEGLEFGTAAYRDRAGELADQVWADPALHAQAVKELTADPYELKARIQTDLLDSQLRSDGALRDAKAYMEAGGILSGDVIRSGSGRFLFGGNGQAVIRSAQEDFDAGLPVAERFTTLTRREYTSQVRRLTTSVAREVTAATQSLASDVTAAEERLSEARQALEAGTGERSAVSAAQSTLTAAVKRQSDFLNAVSGPGDIIKIAGAADRTGSGSRSYLKTQWQRLGDDLTRLRGLVRPAVPEGQFRLLDHITNPPDPNLLYDALNGAARPVPAVVGTGDWMREHLPVENGVLGLGKVTTKSAQQAAIDVQTFHRALDAATDDAAVTRLTEQIKDYLHVHFGMDARMLSIWDDNPQRLLDQIEERARNLASEVFLTYDAPAELRDAVARIRALGYRPMLGSHIGHMWDGSLPPMEELGGALTRRRKVIHSLGLNPDQITSRAAGADARIRMMSELQRAIDTDKRVRMPARATASTVMAVANEILEPELPWASNLAFNAARLMHRKGIDALARQRGITEHAEAVKQYKAEIARALQLRDVPRKQWMHVMTTPAEGVTSGGARWTWDGMDKQTAALLYRAVQRGYAKRGAAMMGWQAIEDWGRAGFGFLDKIATAQPGQDWLQGIANMPNRYVQLRNRLRFDLSPFFDLRRITKQNYKMSLEGVPPKFNPLGEMVDTGSFDRAHKLLNRLLGHESTAAYDDADRYLHQQSVWGIYNSRHYEAYFADTLAREGKTDDEIRAALRKVFDYGSARKGGRSALERSVNTVFFPFSFEKTLLRNTGAYLLDHPGQAVLLSAAVNAYIDADQNQRINHWVEDHLPILHEMEKLNAFAHGINPGEFGGINAPLLNLFLPQQWDTGLTKKNLQRFLPVWKDFSQVWHDTYEQGVIAKNAGFNAVDYAVTLGAKRPYFDPYRPTITPEAQQRKAYELRNQFILALAPTLDANASTSDPMQKFRWPTDPRLPARIQGEAISRTTVGYLVKRWYPAFDPTAGAKYAIDQAENTQQWLTEQKQKNPTLGQSYETFARLADTVIGHLNRDDYDTATAAQVMQQFRAAAIAGSEADPDFYAWYNRTYRWAFGPIEAITAIPQ